jgi:hypothetical protein
MMQTITFTTNDQIGQLLRDIVEENNQPTADIIAESLRYYSRMLQTKKLQRQIKQASNLVAKQSLSVNQSMEASLSDGL